MPLTERIDDQSIARYQKVRGTIEETLRLLDKGQQEKVESEERLRKYEQREQHLQMEDIRAGRRPIKASGVGFERAIGPTHDFLSIEFFEAGLDVARAVGLIETRGGMNVGTGFIVGNGLVLTNNHVLENKTDADDSEFVLDFEDNRLGAPKTVEYFELDPKRFFLTDVDYDYTLVAVSPESMSGRSLEHFGYLPLRAEEGKIRIGDAVNIIQHPGGRMKTVVVHDSRLVHLDNESDEDRYCWYTSDTEPGSSGSPVFNNRWEVMALHRKAVPKTNDHDQYVNCDGRVVSREEAEKNPELLVWVANEGVRVSRLVGLIAAAKLEGDQKRVRDALLELWRHPVRATTVGVESSRRETRPGGQPQVTRLAAAGASTNVPIEINIRIGSDVSE